MHVGLTPRPMSQRGQEYTRGARTRCIEYVHAPVLASRHCGPDRGTWCDMQQMGSAAVRSISGISSNNILRNSCKFN
jgi:hypothetical protein